MSPQQQARWEKIQAMHITPDGVAVAFEDKLVAETGWTRPFALRAEKEYRRFLLLAAEAGHAVSPSPAVDTVWHLHLLYTRSYWNDLCPNVLGRPLHHEPATGDDGNRRSLNDAYARTLASYRQIFGEPPPAEIWPATPSAAKTRRIDPARVVAVPRPVWRAAVVAVFVLLAALLAAIIGRSV